MPNDYDEWGIPLDPEQRRFYRLIDDRTMNADGSQEITLPCGHKFTSVVPLPDAQKYAPCAQCVHDWIKAEQQRDLPHHTHEQH